jgi:hypothetical protein
MAALTDGQLQLLLTVSGDYNVTMNAQASVMPRTSSQVLSHPVVGLSVRTENRLWTSRTFHEMPIYGSNSCV